MPTRRIFTLTVTTVILMHPVMGLARLWVRKTLGAQPPGTVLHGLAEAATIPTGVS